MTSPAPTTLVTGGTGYLATRLLADLLASGAAVRTTVRSLDRADEVRAAVRRAGVDDGGLSFVAASLTEDDGWADALAGIEEVHHTASPMIQSSVPDEVVVPARDGALRVLRAARDAGARRVVLTSSFAAVGYSPKPVRDYDESDWTDPSTPGLPAYPLSKAVAERAAWDFVEREGGDLELVAVNPTWIAGPTLTSSARSSLAYFTGMLDGTITAVPRQRFGMADVRDVSAAHLAAMSTPGAAGNRYLVLADGPTMTFLDVANVLRERLGDLAAQAPTEELPGDEPAPLVIHNERAKRELGLRPRPAVETIVETAESLRDLGLLADPPLV
ncbi:MULTISPECIES: NAD-dependent epimerase/dehydratase family protein [unclassified Leifsonia]|uniref:NAD-dependent epimerase/dehydratase family protein n=1 Tax=unclassified Leifsonia TaxID=2663824 RepID=UPI00036E6E19|nr:MULTISPECIES: NAD-dependent epimerase/dehydratase family protein [unclassified Leifsonia]TDP98501.1 nucleoside-diphosphate-sugar epimerase [Leifsonia sp. 115AMFTsu3.1]